jgi:putative flippase GtrA
MTSEARSVGAVLTPGARQFLKFCVVGGSSFVIDFGAFNVLLRLGQPTALALTVGFLLGVSNGYFWNSRWTFKDRRGDSKRQIPIFFATNVVGFLLNLIITTLVLVVGARVGWTPARYNAAETLNMVLFRSVGKGGGFSVLAVDAAKVCATVVVTVWNFGASKFITFREPAA